MRTVRILYVEDNPDLREIFEEMLQGDQRQIVSCATAEEALTLWHASHFDALITDISLPGMSGTELGRRVLAVHPHCWIVFCSGYEYDDTLGVLGPRVRSLSKPFEFEALERLMDEIYTSLSEAT